MYSFTKVTLKKSELIDCVNDFFPSLDLKLTAKIEISEDGETITITSEGVNYET